MLFWMQWKGLLLLVLVGSSVGFVKRWNPCIAQLSAIWRSNDKCSLPSMGRTLVISLFVSIYSKHYNRDLTFLYVFTEDLHLSLLTHVFIYIYISVHLSMNNRYDMFGIGEAKTFFQIEIDIIQQNRTSPYYPAFIVVSFSLFLLTFLLTKFLYLSVCDLVFFTTKRCEIISLSIVKLMMYVCGGLVGNAQPLTRIACNDFSISRYYGKTDWWFQSLPVSNDHNIAGKMITLTILMR